MSTDAEPITLWDVPITSPAIVIKRYSILNGIMFFLSLIPVLYLILLYFQGIPFALPLPILVLLLPIEIFLWWLLWAFTAVVIARVFLSIAILLSRPRVGVFDATRADRTFRYWNLRATIRKFGLWAIHTFPVPWLDIVAFKILGVKQRGGGTAYFDAWVDPDNLVVGDNTLFGLGSYILTSMIVGEKFIARQTRLGDYTLVGAEAVVGPGSDIGDNVVHGSVSTTRVDQKMLDEWIYMGQPARKMKINKLACTLDYKRTDVEAAGRTEAHTKHFYFKDARRRRKQRKETKATTETLPATVQPATESSTEKTKTTTSQVEEIPGSVEEKKQHLNYSLSIFSFLAFFLSSFIVPLVIFYFYYSLVLIPALFDPPFSFLAFIPLTEDFSLLKTVVFLSIPLVFIGLYIVQVILFVVVGKRLVRYAEKQWPVQLGVYERDFKKSGHILKYYHYRHFLVRILKWRVTRSMFPWLINWAWRYLGVAELGKGVVLEDHFVPPEKLVMEENSYVAQGVVAGTHTVEGVFGRLVIAGCKIGKDSTVMVNVLMGPGGDLEENAHVLPRGALAKAYKLRSGGYYWGIPVYKLARSQVKKITRKLSFPNDTRSKSPGALKTKQ